jgi:hypothetical protein
MAYEKMKEWAFARKRAHAAHLGLPPSDTDDKLVFYDFFSQFEHNLRDTGWLCFRSPTWLIRSCLVQVSLVLSH